MEIFVGWVSSKGRFDIERYGLWLSRYTYVLHELDQ
jgi:hypothetical protein